MPADRLGDRTCDVLVIGGGPAGSATALGLARRGRRVTLLDRARFPRDKPCSEYMSPETVRLLDSLGVLPRLEGAGGALGGTAVFAGGARLTGRFERAEPRPFRSTGLSLARTILDHALLQAAREAGVDVVESTTVEDLTRRGEAVTGVIARTGGRRVTASARLVIGADGLRSVVARRLGGVRRGRIRRIALVTHARGVQGLDDCAELHVGTEGYVGINPMGGGLANVALVVPERLGRGIGGDPEEFLRRRLELFPRVQGRFDTVRFEGPVHATGPFDVRARRVIASGALLVGDAADFFDPFTGEGICAALRGAELAAQHADAALARSPGETVAEEHLRGYLQARRRAFAGKWAIERLVGYAMEWPALFRRAVDRLGARPGMADTFIGVTGQFVPARAVLNPLFLARMVL